MNSKLQDNAGGQITVYKQRQNMITINKSIKVKIQHNK